MTRSLILPFFSSLVSLLFAVSAEILKSSLTNMERQIQRLENDIEHFPKTDDPQDKFVEKMSISFFSDSCFCLLFALRAWFRKAAARENNRRTFLCAAGSAPVCVSAWSKQVL